MKKAFLFSFGLFVALSSLFVSCSDNNGDDDKSDSLICQISVSNTNGGSAKITNYIGSSANVLIGNGVEVVATPDDGYNFLGWYLGNSEVPVSIDAIFTFTASKDIALLAKFEKSFSVSVRSAGNGKVSFKDIEETSLNDVLIGTELTVEAVADANCDFVGWFVNGSEEPVSTEATYTFTVAENTTLVAKFNKWPLVSISSGANGSVCFENFSELSQYIQIGDELTVVATPAESADFVGWFVDGSEDAVSTEATYTFTVADNITLVAKFNKWPLVSISSGGNGSVCFEISSELSQYIQPGEEVTVVATPAESADFVGWFVDGSEDAVSTEATYTFTVAENITLVAKFNKWPLVSIRSYANGSVCFENSSELSQYIQLGEELTVVATPVENYEFIGWYIVTNDEKLVSNTASYTFTAQGDLLLVAKFERIKTFKDGYEYVDLGLPSGVKWASYNVGATKPEEYGGYYAWGETSPKSSYGSDNSVTYGLSYSELKSRGIIGSDGNLTAEYDAARANWGGDWRMPAGSEQRELLNNCTWQWTTLNGVNGYKFTGPNGNSIFLPAAGYRDGTGVYFRGSYGSCWSSSLVSDYGSDGAYFLYFGGYYYGWSFGTRFYGQSVRPVTE